MIMRDIIAASATGATSLIAGIVWTDPAIRAILLSLWIVTLYLLHRLGRDI